MQCAACEKREASWWMDLSDSYNSAPLCVSVCHCMCLCVRFCHSLRQNCTLPATKGSVNVTQTLPSILTKGSVGVSVTKFAFHSHRGQVSVTQTLPPILTEGSVGVSVTKFAFHSHRGQCQCVTNFAFHSQRGQGWSHLLLLL